MSKKTLYLIDGSSYIFRAFFAIRQTLSNSKGLPTNALYGFTNMLLKVVREEKPDFLAVVFDTKEKTFRHQLYPEYKANRDEPPDDLKPQFDYFRPLVEAFNIVCLAKEGFEADDIIGTLAKQGELKDMEVVIVSGDKDMMQLVSPRISMLDTMKNKRIREPEVEEKFGVAPEKVIDVMGLMGDSSDNVPGVKGVGPKTATELIQKYGAIEEIYEHIEDITKKKLKENLETHRDLALLSRELVTIDSAVPLDCKLIDLKMKEPDAKKLRAIFSELEFTSLLKEFGGEEESASASEKNVEKNYKCILKEDELDALVKQLKSAGEFALDLETTSKRPVHARMVGISFACKDHEAYYIPVQHSYIGVPEQLDKALVLDKLRDILESDKYKKFGHNIKYDLIVLRNEGIELKGIAFDSMLAAYVMDPSRRNLSLDDLSLELLQHNTIKYKDVVGTASKEIGFDQVELEQATEYAAEDSDMTYLLTRILQSRLEGDDRKLYEEIELPLVDVLAEIELNGVYLDEKQLADLSKFIAKELKKHEQKIYEIAGEEFNINSPKQLATILFDKLELPVVKKTKTGPSTDMSVLEELASQHELPENIVAYRQLGKLKSTYVDALPREIFKETGRVHTSFNQTIAATGRLSSTDPNLQNIPIRTELGKGIREAFVAPKGSQLFSADYSQVELRLLAHVSEDPVLIKAFKNNEDIHSRTAAEIFGVALDAVSEENRRMAKAVNFGIVYGLSAFGLSRQLKITPKEAKAFIEQYFDLYRNVKTYMTETVESARSRGYSITLKNRKRYLPDLNSKNHQARSAAERVAINSPIQGSAADLIKMAMINISHQFKEQELKSKMILQVHDELLFECPTGEKKQVESLVVQAMEGVYPLKVPLVVDTGWGSNWNQAH